MYKDAEGNFNGEALIVYYKPESVKLAVQMLDDSDFRLGVQGPGGPMSVVEADPSFKRHQEDEQKDDDADGGKPKEGAEQVKPKNKKKHLTQDQHKILENRQKMDEYVG